MPDPLIPLTRALDRVGVAVGTDEADQVSALLDAVSDEVRAITRRAFEGEATDYVQVLATDGTRGAVVLPNVPVTSVTSVARAWFDGTHDEPWAATDWRLEDAARGRIALAHRADLVRVSYAVSGEIPPGIAQAVEDWVADRWATRAVVRGQSGYQTGDDAESWASTIVGTPPAAVGRALALAHHSAGGAVI
jgi:hypothetical protein